ncbi:MAG: YciI family protein [Mucilaginibacter sp.]
MKKFILLLVLLLAGLTVFAQAPAKTKSQFLFIIRFKADFKPASDEAVKKNIKEWQDYMGNLAQSGNIVAGYRPANEGLTIKGTTKELQSTPFVGNGELVSSVMVIKAVDMDEAKAIADKCPVFEFGGSVEVRAIMDTAGH